MKHRRLRRDPAALEITAFLNLVVVLVPFLLSTAVFTRLAVLDLKLPPPAAAGPEQVKAGQLQLEVVVRADALEVGDRLGGLIRRIERGAAGHDLAALDGVLQQVKARFPDERAASLLAEPDTPYDTLVQVMDALRARTDAGRSELFPQIAIGDAPQRRSLAAGRAP